MNLMDILSQVAASGNASEQHYDQVAQGVPADVLNAGLSHAFSTDQTPPMGQMVGQLFGNSNAQQQAGVLNQVLASVGPALIASLAGGVLSKVMQPGATQITPEQASQLSPQQVQDVVTHASEVKPGIADDLAGFYAQHSGLIKTLGGMALAVAMSKMKDHMAER